MNQVPADGILISGHSLDIDESSMTGESKIVSFTICYVNNIYIFKYNDIGGFMYKNTLVGDFLQSTHLTCFYQAVFSLILLVWPVRDIT